jgi:hypothetical protein
MKGRLLWLSYQLDRHYQGPLTLGRWIVVIGALIVVIGFLPRVRLAPAIMIAAGVVVLLTLALLIWGRARRYHVFKADARCGPPATARPFQGLEHVKVRATGRFSVEGQEQLFADLEAIYHTFQTREHAVMAFAPRSRFLFSGSPGELKGMWYVFVTPAQILKIETGVLAFGRRLQPALRLVYRGFKKNGKPRTDEICLAFENETDMNRVAQDLWYERVERKS